MLVHVADEVRRAALPGAGKHPLDRVPQAFVLVRDGQAHAPKPAGPQRAQELDPEGLGLDLAEIQADHLAHA